MAPETLLGGVLLLALVAYVLGGGADFGGGVWDLFARGPGGHAQRTLIAHAIGPVWEANHVWLILVIVVLFTCFPAAYAGIATALNTPLTLMLVGIVLRGAAFTFRTYDRPDAAHRRWSRPFAIASTVTPVMLGACVGAIASGRVEIDPATGHAAAHASVWLAPFPLAVGLFALVLFAYLAAVYLTVEADTPELSEAFRRRALASGVLLGAIAALCLALAPSGAPRVWDGLATRRWSLPFHALTAAVAAGALAGLWLRRYVAARAFAIVHAALIVCGWGFAQHPYLVEPDLTLANTAAEAGVLRAVLGALGIGAVVLAPSLFYLFRVFKGAHALPAERPRGARGEPGGGP